MLGTEASEVLSTLEDDNIEGSSGSSKGNTFSSVTAS